MIKAILVILYIFLYLIDDVVAYAAPEEHTTQKHTTQLPRFVSIKSSRVNARTGPNLRYPIKWVFIQRGEPVEVVAEFEQWRKIVDINLEESWVHESMLSRKRYVVVSWSSDVFLYKSNSLSEAIAKIEPGARAELVDCSVDRCKIALKNNKGEMIKGYSGKKYLWGVYESEIL